MIGPGVGCSRWLAVLGILSIGAASSAQTPRQSDQVRQLISWLSYPDSSMREQATEQLGRLGEPAVLPLIELLGSGGKYVRPYAAKALGALRDARAVPALILALGDDENWVLQLEAEKALLQIGAPAVESLMAALADPASQPRSRGRIVAVLGKLGDGRSAVLLLRAMRDDALRDAAVSALKLLPPEAFAGVIDPALAEPVVAELCRAAYPDDARQLLARLGPAAVGPLVAVLGDRLDARARERAVDALGGIKDPRAVDPLVGVLAEEITPSQLGQRAALALKQIGDARSIEPMLAILHDQGSRKHKWATEVLSGIDDPRATAALIGELNSPVLLNINDAMESLVRSGGDTVRRLLAESANPSSPVRCVSLQVLGKRREPAALELILGALVDPSNSPAVRRCAARAAESMGDTRAVPNLISALKDSDVLVRRESAATLHALADPRAADALAAALADPDVTVRESAAEALVTLADRRMMSALIVALRDPSGSVRSSAAKALGRIGDPQAIPALVAILQLPNQLVQNSAAGALADIGPAAVDALLAVVGGTDSSARRFAAQALGGIADPRAQERLRTALRERDLVLVAGGSVFFVLLGAPGSESTLVEALNREGGTDMAVVLLNSGNALLEEAARSWAQAHGVLVRGSLGTWNVRWGGKR